MPHELGHFSWGTDPVTTGAFGAGGVSGAAGLLESDIDWAQMRTPTQDWQQFMLGVAPGMQRAPLQQMGNQLQARYALAQPFLGDEPSFAGFLAGGPAGQADYDTLRARAQSAANIAELSRQDYANQLMQAGGPGTEAGRRLAMQAANFNPLQGGSTGNQAAIANMLAMQRGQGQTGTYQGAMGNAIQRAMNAMYTARQAQGYDPNTFLNWYMGMTNPPA
jgi:hypothetical protein